MTVVTQSNSSIILKWDKVNNIPTYILQYGDISHYIGDNVSHQEASVTYEVSSLNAGKEYSFTLITVFEKVNSTGLLFNAMTGR